MSEASAAIARAVLYEGYVLYPYRPSSLKNRQRWTFGALAPRAGAAAAEPWSMQTQILVEGEGDAVVTIRVRFLHLVDREGADWQEAVEREVALAPARVSELAAAGREERFWFPDSVSGEGDEARRQEAVTGAVEVHAMPLGEAAVHQLTVMVHNLSPAEGATAHLRVMASTHTAMAIEGGAFVSLMDPPEALRAAAEACVNLGTWPVLVGQPGSRDAVLSAPIVLYDHPQIAPESPGDFFDGTEIDEMLALRVLTLTDEEKAAAAACDPRVRALLDRVETMAPAQLMRLHGALREVRAAGRVAAGTRVRLRPSRRADAFDLALDGKTATVVSLERDQDGRTMVGVAVDDDPGRDLGELGLPGHRFFFGIDEVELIP